MTKISNSGLVLCALIPFFFACEDPSALGLELEDQSSKTEVKIIEFKLPAKTIYIDSLRTDDLGQALFGSVYNDSIVGNIKARTYFEYFGGSGTLPSDSIKQDTLEYVSVFLHIKYSALSVNDTSTANENFTVHLASDTLFSTVTYLRNMHTPFDEANPIGTHSGSIRYRADDSVRRIKLTDSFGEYLFNKLDLAGRSSNKAYRDSLSGTSRPAYYPALVLEPQLDYEHLLSLDFTSQKMGIYVNMKSKVSDSTYVYKFLIGGDYYSEIIRNRASGKYADLVTDYSESSDSSGTVHLNATAGLYPKFDLTEFIKFTKNSENIIVSRAELSYKKDNDLMPPAYKPVVSKVRYYFPKAGGRINTLAARAAYPVGNLYGLFSSNGYLSRESGASNLLTSFYNKDDKAYGDLVTFFCQDLLDLQSAGAEPSTNSLILWNPDATTVGQTPILKSSVKLKVYYTELKK